MADLTTTVVEPVVVNLFGNDTPATIDAGDTNSVNVGLSFYVTQPTNLTAVRFYKASTNTGTHEWGLWSNAGTLLDSGTITGETASGWQTFWLSTPYALTEDTRYYIGILCPNGHYSAENNYFANDKTTTVGSLTLRAPATGGTAYLSLDWYTELYTYSASLARPINKWQNECYFVEPQVGSARENVASDTVDTDVSAGGTAHTRTATDSITASDTSSLVGAYTRTITDSITASDTGAVTGDWTRAAVDSVTVTDIVDVNLTVGGTGLERSATDSTTITDSATVDAAFARTVTDPAGATDPTSFDRALDTVEPVNATDPAAVDHTVSGAHQRTHTDPATATDPASFDRETQFTDTVNASDIIDVTHLVGGTIIERSATDPASGTDQITVDQQFQVIVTDLLAAADSPIFDRSHVFTDTAAATDPIVAGLELQLALVDTAAGSDTAGAALTEVLTVASTGILYGRVL